MSDPQAKVDGQKDFYLPDILSSQLGGWSNICKFLSANVRCQPIILSPEEVWAFSLEQWMVSFKIFLLSKKECLIPLPSWWLPGHLFWGACVSNHWRCSQVPAAGGECLCVAITVGTYHSSYSHSQSHLVSLLWPKRFLLAGKWPKVV